MHEIKLAPERRQVGLTYRVPGPIVEKVVAGVLYGNNHDDTPSIFKRRLILPARGRRPSTKFATTTPPFDEDAISLPSTTLAPSPKRNGPQERTPGAVIARAVS